MSWIEKYSVNHKYTFFTHIDFNNITGGPPELCGWDLSSGEDKFCCEDLHGEPSLRSRRNLVTNPQPPLYPEKESGNARPCRDHSPECARWASVKPDSCKPHPDPLSAESLDHSYQFMREACMESCGRCQDFVG